MKQFGVRPQNNKTILVCCANKETRTVTVDASPKSIAYAHDLHSDLIERVLCVFDNEYPKLLRMKHGKNRDIHTITTHDFRYQTDFVKNPTALKNVDESLEDISCYETIEDRVNYVAKFLGRRYVHFNSRFKMSLYCAALYLRQFDKIQECYNIATQVINDTDVPYSSELHEDLVNRVMCERFLDDPNTSMTTLSGYANIIYNGDWCLISTINKLDHPNFILGDTFIARGMGIANGSNMVFPLNSRTVLIVLPRVEGTSDHHDEYQCERYMNQAWTAENTRTLNAQILQNSTEIICNRKDLLRDTFTRCFEETKDNTYDLSLYRVKATWAPRNIKK